MDVRFVLPDPADEPFPDLRDVLLRKLESETEVDESDEVTEVVIVPFVWKTTIENNRSDEQSPLGPRLGGKGRSVGCDVGNWSAVT